MKLRVAESIVPSRGWLQGLKELVRPYYLKWLYFKLDPRNRPKSFDVCWQYPHGTIESFGAELGRESRDHQDLIFLPMADWHGCLQRSQQLATSLAAAGHRCFYLNPHLGREFSTTYLRSPRLLLSQLARRVFELHTHLLREPVFHHRCLRTEETRVIVGALGDLLTIAGSTNPVVVVSFPLWAEVAYELRRRFGCRIIYDCHDLLSGFDDISADLLAAEENLLLESDLVLCSSQWLLADTLDRNPSLEGKVELVRNGVHQADFRDAIRDQQRIDPNAPRVVGYIGALNFWFDVEAVLLAARVHPEWKFLLVGPVANASIDALRALANVAICGEVPASELNGYLLQMDVGIIPFIRCPLTMATNPIKLYEYFACGLPVVSTRLPEVEEFVGLAYIADSSEHLVRLLEQAMEEDDPDLRQQRISVAQVESWSARCAQLEESIARLAPVRAERGAVLAP